MDQNTQLKIEFFKLCGMLNKSNLHANQKTEILFYIDTQNHQSTLYAATNRIYKIQLISKHEGFEWKSCGFCGLTLIEQELSKLFNYQNLEMLSSTKIIKSFIFKQFDE